MNPTAAAAGPVPTRCCPGGFGRDAADNPVDAPHLADWLLGVDFTSGGVKASKLGDGIHHLVALSNIDPACRGPSGKVLGIVVTPPHHSGHMAEQLELANQLRLVSSGPKGHRLNRATRQMGLRGVAQARAVLAEVPRPPSIDLDAA